ARYLERTAPWIERVGVEYIRERIADDAVGREALTARFLYSQSFSQDDPWAERAEGADSQLHAHLGEVRPFEMMAAE
ncbi:MAG: hypothetical protein ACREB5_07115, partial [Sphingomonadaceae bacterium]